MSPKNNPKVHRKPAGETQSLLGGIEVVFENDYTDHMTDRSGNFMNFYLPKEKLYVSVINGTADWIAPGKHIMNFRRGKGRKKFTNAQFDWMASNFQQAMLTESGARYVAHNGNDAYDIRHLTEFMIIAEPHEYETLKALVPSEEDLYDMMFRNPAPAAIYKALKTGADLDLDKLATLPEKQSIKMIEEKFGKDSRKAKAMTVVLKAKIKAIEKTGDILRKMPARNPKVRRAPAPRQNEWWQQADWSYNPRTGDLDGVINAPSVSNGITGEGLKRGVYALGVKVNKNSKVKRYGHITAGYFVNTRPEEDAWARRYSLNAQKDNSYRDSMTGATIAFNYNKNDDVKTRILQPTQSNGKPATWMDPLWRPKPAHYRQGMPDFNEEVAERFAVEFIESLPSPDVLIAKCSYPDRFGEPRLSRPIDFSVIPNPKVRRAPEPRPNEWWEEYDWELGRAKTYFATTETGHRLAIGNYGQTIQIMTPSGQSERNRDIRFEEDLEVARIARSIADESDLRVSSMGQSGDNYYQAYLNPIDDEAKLKYTKLWLSLLSNDMEITADLLNRMVVGQSRKMPLLSAASGIRIAHRDETGRGSMFVPHKNPVEMVDDMPVDIMQNYYSVIYRQSRTFDKDAKGNRILRYPKNMQKAAVTITTENGAKVRAGLLKGKWAIQAVLIPRRRGMTKRKAVKLSDEVVSRLTRSNAPRLRMNPTMAKPDDWQDDIDWDNEPSAPLDWGDEVDWDDVERNPKVRRKTGDVKEYEVDWPFWGGEPAFTSSAAKDGKVSATFIYKKEEIKIEITRHFWKIESLRNWSLQKTNDFMKTLATILPKNLQVEYIVNERTTPYKAYCKAGWNTRSAWVDEMVYKPEIKNNPKVIGIRLSVGNGYEPMSNAWLARWVKAGPKSVSKLYDMWDMQKLEL